MSYRLRCVTPTGRSKVELDRLQAACLPDDDPCEYRPTDLWWLVRDSSGVAVAFACVRPTPDDPCIWYLARAGVAQEARGQGLQARLIRVRLAAAKRHGAVAVVTDCTTLNPASANSLIASGFRVYTPAYAWALPNSIYWRIVL